MVGKIFTAHRATFGQLDMKKTLKVVGRFIHNDAEGMKRIFAKAEAKIEAKEAVFNAIKGLNRVGQYRSPDLRYLDSIITKARGSATGEQRDNPDFRVALFDAAWKKSAGQGKLGILLKKRGGFIDGTRALKSDLRKLAKTGHGLHDATMLAALLEAIKKHAKNEQADAPIPADIIELLKDGSGASKLLTVDFDALERESIPGLIYHVGQALTEFLHPEFLSAEVHSAEGSDNRQMDSRNVLRLFESFFELFALARDEISPNIKVTESFYKCYELGLTIAALKIFGDKKSFAEKDIALLKGFLKSPPITREGETNEAAVERWQNLDTALDKIDLKASSTEVLLQMSRVYARHCIKGNVQVLMSPETMSQVDDELASAKNADDVINLLKAAFDGAFEGMDSIAFSTLLVNVAKSGPT